MRRSAGCERAAPREHLRDAAARAPAGAGGAPARRASRLARAPARRRRALRREDVRSLDDLRAPAVHRRRPTCASTTRSGCWPCRASELARVHASSGTGGKPTSSATRARDLDVWAEVMARCLATAGRARRDARPQRQRLRAVHRRARLPPGRRAPRRDGRAGLRRRHRAPGHAAARPQAQVLCATPSYALHDRRGAATTPASAPTSCRSRSGVFGAEPWTEAMREQIERGLGLRPCNIYGLSEIVGPGVAVECLEARDGLHVNEDHFLVEVVDPETGEPLPDGADGELVFTTLTKEALPLLRYRTGDIALADPGAVRLRAHARPHEHGARPPRRHADHPRRQPLPVGDRARPARRRGRRAALPADRRAPGGARRGAPCAASPPRTASTAPTCSARIAHALRERTGISIAVELLAPGTVPRSEGKAVRGDRPAPRLTHAGRDGPRADIAT